MNSLSSSLSWSFNWFKLISLWQLPRIIYNDEKLYDSNKVNNQLKSFLISINLILFSHNLWRYFWFNSSLISVLMVWHKKNSKSYINRLTLISNTCFEGWIHILIKVEFIGKFFGILWVMDISSEMVALLTNREFELKREYR